MKIRRPLCVVGIMFIICIYIFTGFKPLEPVIDADTFEDRTLLVRGIAEDYSVKNNQLWLFLSDVSLCLSSELSTDKLAGINYPADKNIGIIVKTDYSDDIVERIRLGACIEAKGVFKSFELPANEGQFDARHYYKIRGYDGQIIRSRILRSTLEKSSIKNMLRNVRNRISDIIDRSLDETNAGILKAMLVGEKSSIGADTKELYQNAGISHVLALSGLHIAAIGLFILKLMKKTGLGLIPSSLISGFILVMYTVLTGMATSTVRALIMFILAVVADAIGRTYDFMSSAALSAILILVENPYYVYDCGFLLSFGAIVGIGVVYPVVYRILGLKSIYRDFVTVRNMCLLNHQGKSRKVESDKVNNVKIRDKEKETVVRRLIVPVYVRIEQSLCVSISITVVTLPITSYFFFQISRYGIILNLIIIPLMSLILLLGFLGIALVGLGGYTNIAAELLRGLGQKCFKITDVILKIYDFLGRKVAGTDGNLWIIGKISIMKTVIYYSILFVIIFCNRENLKRVKKYIDCYGRIFLSNNRRNVTKRKNKITCSKYLTEPYGKTCRNRIFYRFTAVLIYIIAIVIIQYYPRKNLEIRNLFVGQGDCCIVSGKGLPVIMIDGGSTDTRQVGKYRILPVLKSNGINEVDYCFISHMDADHVNGIFEILENETCGVRIDTVILSGPCASEMLRKSENVSSEENEADYYNRLYKVMKGTGLNVRIMTEGTRLVLENLHIECLGPINGSEYDGNDSSLILLLKLMNSSSDFTAFFGGDISTDVEETILDHIGPVTYLKVSHHGSRYSSGVKFLQKTHPGMSVISAGIDNSYGHPHEETIIRLQEVGTGILSTAENGEIITYVDENIWVRKFLMDSIQ